MTDNFIYPRAKKQNITDIIFFDRVPVVRLDYCDARLTAGKFNGVFGNGENAADVFLSAYYSAPDCENGDEAFTVSCDNRDGKVKIAISCLSDKAFVRALFRVKKLLLRKMFFTGRITDYPQFAVRGYIEGFYGKPWSFEQRLNMIEFMASNGENTCYYAPKDDIYHRRKWREAYPGDSLRKLKALVVRAEFFCMDFVYCIAPGLDIGYSDTGDFSRLASKLKQLYSVGIKHFGLLLDDIAESFTCDKDSKMFPDFASAHIYLVNRCFDFIKTLDGECRLTVCPTEYWGKGDSEYLRKLGKGIPQEVSLFFTGRDICSREITGSEAEYFGKNTGHRPLYWDNYPVNDAEMFKEMHMAPINGREPELYRYAEGLISNCSEYFECGKIPLASVADYLWSPLTYDRELSYNRILDELFTSGEKSDFILLGDNLRTSCLRDENSRIAGEYLSRATSLIMSGKREKAISVAGEYTVKVRKAKEGFAGRTAPIYTELGEWIDKFNLMGEILDLALLYLESGDGTAKEELIEKTEKYNNTATVLTAFCFREYVETVIGEI